MAVHAAGRSYHLDVVSGAGAAGAIGVLAWWLLARGRSGPWVAMLAVLVCAAVLALSPRLYALAGLALTTIAALRAFPRRAPAHYPGAVIGALVVVLGPSVLLILTSGMNIPIVAGVTAVLVPAFTAAALAVAVAEALSRVPRRPAVVGVAFLGLYGLYRATVLAVAAIPLPDASSGDLVAVRVTSPGSPFDLAAGVGGVLVLGAVALIVTAGAQEESPAGR
ncbi:hypothetical protein Val02_26020 [Virgisporangium aliadipatigenens]|uniref:Uncharacterized protein n=1 Tax=Virgisporangium aliadipatigenens TaxID=741659 RepID=A0A8J4DQ95_9ACTN|nr:hypothetical protein Val02_26020 [Virgisporangium aliadipatigenens]